MDVRSTTELLPLVSLAFVTGLAALILASFLVMRLMAGPPRATARRWALIVSRALVVATLLGVLANPVHVDESPGPIERPNVFYLIDASQSMALGDEVTRWDEVIRTIGEANELVRAESRAQLSVFRFGAGLSAVKLPGSAGSGSSNDHLSQSDTEDGSQAEVPNPPSVFAPTDSDTQLASGLRQLTGRFGRSPPTSVVLFSDGRARDPAGAAEIARRYRGLKVPIHVLPVGDADRGGDVAIASMVAPVSVRKYSQVVVQVFVRSYGYDGKRTELRLSALSDEGSLERELNRLPITLRSGVQSFNLTFESDLQMRRIQASVLGQSNEVSVDNNSFASEIAIDRTKIRVLYVEGGPGRVYAVRQGGRSELRGGFSYLQKALSEDPDIECMVMQPVVPGSSQLRWVNSSRIFPRTATELFAFDAIVLSNISRRAFSTQQLELIDEWISQRGGGLCMVGGPNSFAAGGWRGGVLEEMLPVVMRAERRDWLARQLSVQPAKSLHPIWRIVADQTKNSAILKSLPAFSGTSRVLRAKTTSTVLAVTNSTQSDEGPMPVIAVAPYGKGRTMAMTTGITEPWATKFARSWGDSDNRYYAKFWRNVIYWLTENSSIGRRRLVAWTDKRFYKAGETLTLEAEAYDEGTNRTTDYRVSVMIEPVSLLDPNSIYSPVCWPEGQPRTSGEEGPYIAWGEEFEVKKQPGEERYALELAMGDPLTADSANQSLRMELTAYEDFTQVDSASLAIQVLDDQFEQQNPLPNHELLHQIASLSGGKVLPDTGSLAVMIKDLPIEVGPPVVRKVPLWSKWWLLAGLLALLTAEWVWRRGVGLA